MSGSAERIQTDQLKLSVPKLMKVSYVCVRVCMCVFLK